jgi:ribosomal protein S15
VSKILKANSHAVCIRLAPSATNLPLPIMSKASVSTFAQRKAHKDPYALAQSAQRKAVNLARQKVLQAERKQALGDPVRGITTPFLESFDNVGGSAKLSAIKRDGVVVGLEPKIENDATLGYFLSPEEFKKSIEHSYSLTEPTYHSLDPMSKRDIRAQYEDGHKRASVALARIVSLANASQEAKTRANKQRCIETFGRHRTDEVLRPRAPVNPSIVDPSAHQKTPRAGPDTGSSEVQIAILTAKIRVLADQLAKKGGNKDKINKRNLRVMVHKRQKHLNYLKRKERGSDRWQNLITTLGLTEGTYKGEISL